MVRLKAETHFSPIYILTKFQFQNGAIKSCVICIESFSIFDFNSKMVRLKAETFEAGEAVFMNFNSKMVRLKETSHYMVGQ